VIKREYLQRVRSKWFIVATVGGPLMMAGLIFVPAYFAVKKELSSRAVVLLDDTGVLSSRLAPRLEEAGFDVLEEVWTQGAVEDLTARADSGEIGGFIVLNEETLTTGSADFYTTSRPSLVRRVTMRSALMRSALEASLADSDVDVEALLGGGELRLELLEGEEGSRDAPEFIVGFAGSMLLYAVIILWSVSVLRATLEEKTSRIAEVIVSAMKPWHLMFGKIIGVGAVGLTQMLFWALSLALILILALPAIVAARPEMAAIERIPEFLPGPAGLALFVGYFLFGFFIFSGLYAAVGAMCNSEEEAQQAQLPVLFLVITPVLFLTVIVTDPSSVMARSLSLFPFFSPILMWPRVAAGVVPAWEIALSFVGMAAAVVAVAWVAGRIYKVGMLMTGKRPTLPELWRWVREA